eukprot:TRINITY_DN24897_c0_g1_i1.p1 TRINITY_DN24897_c0_g1~~TRINITY_DN24897_c0_g1_i1.p1  ORF type:complete len:159 (-),score=36.09 TRINITY_DN24897_c0_g1_i1:32-463(-)
MGSLGWSLLQLGDHELSFKTRTGGNSAMILLFYLMMSEVSSITWSGQCVIDDANRLLDHLQYMGTTNTPQVCMDYCAAKAYAFAGVQAWAGVVRYRHLHQPTVIRQDEECNQKCPGDSTQFCGADWRMNVYEIMSSSLGLDSV